LAQAKLAAQTAIEMGLLKIKSNPNWRSSYPSGTWINNQSIGHGSCSLEAFSGNDTAVAVLDYKPQRIPKPSAHRHLLLWSGPKLLQDPLCSCVRFLLTDEFSAAEQSNLCKRMSRALLLTSPLLVALIALAWFRRALGLLSTVLGK
jgi:hypothetical protein